MNGVTKINQLWKDGGWRGALTVLLGSPQLSSDGRICCHVDLDREEIHFDRMLTDRTFSSGERILIEIAASLFNDEVTINLWTAFSRLDDRGAKLAMTALENFRSSEGLESLMNVISMGENDHHANKSF